METQFLPEIDLTRCDGCGRCVEACPSGALGMQGGVARLAQPDLCRWDAECELACPHEAIRVPYLIVFGP